MAILNKYLIVNVCLRFLFVCCFFGCCLLLFFVFCRVVLGGGGGGVCITCDATRQSVLDNGPYSVVVCLGKIIVTIFSSKYIYKSHTISYNQL